MAAENPRRAEPSLQRELLVPFEDLNVLLEGPTRRVMLSREEYAELLLKAKQEDEVRAPLEALLIAADYAATIEQGRAQIVGTLVVDVLEDGLHAVPLDLGGVTLREAALDGRAAPIGPAANGRPGLLVEGKGRHELILRMEAPLGTTAARQVLQFRLPRPPSAAMRLTMPGDVELKSGASVASREVDTDAGVTRFELIPDQGDATLVMTLNSHLRRTEEAVVARSVLVDEVFESHERLLATVTMDVLHRPAERFRFALPDRFEVTEVASPLLARWDVEQADGRRVLNVWLQEPTTDTVVLRLSAIKTLGSDDAAAFPRAWQFPQLEPLDVVGHVAVVGLLVEPRLETRRIVADENALSPIAVATLVAAMPAGRLAAEPGTGPLSTVVAYYAPGGDCRLAAEFDKPPAALDVRANLLLTLDDAGQRIDGGLAVMPRMEKLFALDFTAPAGWRVERVTGAGGRPLAFERFDGPDGAARFQVRLPSGIEVGQSYQINFHATRTPDDWLGDWAGQEREVAFPEFAVVGASRDEGVVAIAVGDDLTVRPADVALRPLDESDLRQYGLATGAAHLAYRYEVPGYRATLAVGRTEPRLVARTISLLRIQPGALSARYEVIYNVQQARTRNLSLLLPTATPETLSIVGLGGVKLKDFSSEPVEFDGRAMRRWNVQLEQPSRGKVHLAVDFQQPLADALADYAPPLVEADGERLVNQSGLVAVEGSAELNVEIKTPAARADVGELAEAEYQPGRRLLGVYRFVGRPPQLALDVARAPGYALPSAVVERAELDTYLAVDGTSQTQALLRLRTKALYLTAELPRGSELWAVWLDDKPLKPQRDATGLLVSVPADDAGVVRELKIVYATKLDATRGGKLAMPGPRLWLRGEDPKTPVEVPLADLHWRVHVPGGYEIVQSGGTVVPISGQLPKPRPAALDVAGAIYWLAGGYQPYWFVPDILRMGTDISEMPAADRASNAGYEGEEAYESPTAASWDAGDEATDAGIDWAEPPDEEPAAYEPETDETPDNSDDTTIVMRDPSQRGVVDQLYEAEITHVPFPDEPPIAYPDAASWAELSTKKLQGVRSLAIDLDMAGGAGPVVAFRSLGAEPVLEVTLARRLSHCMLGWGLALVVGLIGLGITGRTAGAKTRFVIGVGTVATLVPLLFASTELARAANMVFYAASLLIPYYLAVGLVRWFVGLFRRRPARVVTATVVTTATLLALAVMNVSALAANPAEASVPFSVQIVPRPGPVDVPDDAILLPYDPDSDTGIRDADRLLVPYDRYVELWNRANPDRKIETTPPPVSHALAGVSYTATLAGDDFLLLQGRVTIDVFTDGYVTVPLNLAGGVLAEARLDGEPARVQEIILGPGPGFIPVVGQSTDVPTAQQQAQQAAPSPPGSPENASSLPSLIQGMGLWQLQDLPRVGPQRATLLPTDDPFADPQEAAPAMNDPFADDPFAPNAHPNYPLAPPASQSNAPTSQSANRPAVQTGVEPIGPTGVPLSFLAFYVSGKGRHELTLAVRMPISGEGGWRAVEGVVPSAAATALALTVPRAQTELRLGPSGDRRSLVTTEAGERIDTAPGGGKIALQWRPKVAEAQLDRSLTAHSTVVFDVQEDGLRALWQLQLAFGHGERDRFRLGLPEGYLLEKIEGANVRGWQRDAERPGAIEVELLQPARDAEQCTLHLWRKGPVDQAASAEFDVPSLSVAEAALHDGQLIVRRSPLLDLRTVDRVAVSRIDLGGPADRLAASTGATRSPLGIRAYQAFRFSSSPFRLQLAAAPVEAKLAARVQTILRVAEDERTVECRVVLSAEARPVHRIELMLPADVEITSVSVPGISQWNAIDEDGRKRLSVHLSAGQTGQVALLLGATLGERGPIEQLALPRIEVLGVERQEGEIAVQLDPGLDVRAEQLENCRAVLLRQLHAWLDAGQQRATRLGLEYDRPDYQGTLRLSARVPEVACETITNVRVTNLAVEETILLDYTIHNAGIRQIAFRLPAGMEDCRISVPLLRQKRIEPTAEGDLRVWIELQDEVMDELRVLVENDRPLLAESSAAPIPRVEQWPVTRRYVALESAGLDEVVVDEQQTVGLDALSRQQAEWAQLSAQLGDRITQAYLVSPGADAPRLVFQTKTRQAVATARAAIGLAETVLVVDANGAYRARVTYRLDNATEQALEVELPEGATLWAAEVAGDPVKPASVPGAGNARLARIPLVKTAAGDLDYAVVLIYGGQMPLLGNLSGADFPLMHTKNINVERSQVELFVPKTHRLFGFGGTMGQASERADLTAGYVAYAGKKAEQLIETLRSKDKWASVRGAYNLKQKMAEMEELQSAQSAGYVNPKLAAELDANKEVLQRAERELAKYEREKSGEQEGREGTVARSDSNRSQMATRFNEQLSSRSKNVVQDVGSNWRVEEGTVWLSGNNEFKPLENMFGADLDIPFQNQPAGNGVVVQSEGQPYQVFGQRSANGSGLVVGDTDDALGTYSRKYVDAMAIETLAQGADLRETIEPGATATGLASLALELPEHEAGFYRAYRFTTPRGEVRLTAWAVADSLLARVAGLCSLVVVVFLVVRIARRASAGGFAWLVSPTCTTLWIVLGLAGVLFGVLPVAGLVAVVAGIVQKFKPRRARAAV